MDCYPGRRDTFLYSRKTQWGLVMSGDHNLKGWHHFYLGILIMFTGFFLIFFWNGIGGMIIMTMGILVALDDAIGHAFLIRTPLNRIYSYLYGRYEWIRKFNLFMDSLLGKIHERP